MQLFVNATEKYIVLYPKNFDCIDDKSNLIMMCRWTNLLFRCFEEASKVYKTDY